MHDIINQILCDFEFFGFLKSSKSLMLEKTVESKESYVITLNCNKISLPIQMGVFNSNGLELFNNLCDLKNLMVVCDNAKDKFVYLRHIFDSLINYGDYVNIDVFGGGQTLFRDYYNWDSLSNPNVTFSNCTKSYNDILDKLLEEIKSRKTLLEKNKCQSIAQYNYNVNDSESYCKNIVLIIDNIVNFLLYENPLTDIYSKLKTILINGGNLGIYVVVSDKSSAIDRILHFYNYFDYRFKFKNVIAIGKISNERLSRIFEKKLNPLIENSNSYNALYLYRDQLIKVDYFPVAKIKEKNSLFRDPELLYKLRVTSNGYVRYKCPRCGSIMTITDNFCKNCRKQNIKNAFDVGLYFYSLIDEFSKLFKNEFKQIEKARVKKLLASPLKEFVQSHIKDFCDKNIPEKSCKFHLSIIIENDDKFIEFLNFYLDEYLFFKKIPLNKKTLIRLKKIT